MLGNFVCIFSFVQSLYKKPANNLIHLKLWEYFLMWQNFIVMPSSIINIQSTKRDHKGQADLRVSCAPLFPTTGRPIFLSKVLNNS